jgi:hypothetical protein
MGIPGWKIILSMPMSYFIYFAGYFIPDAKKTKPVVTTKSKWLTRATDWILARTRNTIIFLSVLFSVSFISVIVSPSIVGAVMFAIIVAPLVILLLWIRRVGVDKLRKNIGGAFSNVAILWNALTIVAFITGIALTPTPAIEIDAAYEYETIEIIEDKDE